MREVKPMLTKALTKDLISKYGILNGSKYFSLDGSPNILVFQPLPSYFTSRNGKIHSWICNGKSEKSIKTPSTFRNNL